MELQVEGNELQDSVVAPGVPTLHRRGKAIVQYLVFRFPFPAARAAAT